VNRRRQFFQGRSLSPPKAAAPLLSSRSLASISAEQIPALVWSGQKGFLRLFEGLLPASTVDERSQSKSVLMDGTIIGGDPTQTLFFYFLSEEISAGLHSSVAAVAAVAAVTAVTA